MCVRILDGPICDRVLEFDLDLDFDLVRFRDLDDLDVDRDSGLHFVLIEIELFVVFRFNSQT